MNPRRIAKALAAVATACGITAAAITSGHFEAPATLSSVVVSWFGVVTVFAIPNRDNG